MSMGINAGGFAALLLLVVPQAGARARSGAQNVPDSGMNCHAHTRLCRQALQLLELVLAIIPLGRCIVAQTL